MNSMTMHILGGLVDAAMKSTTLGCRKAVITRTCTGGTIVVITLSDPPIGPRWVRTSSLKDFSMSLVTFSEAIILTATSVPFHMALCTWP